MLLLINYINTLNVVKMNKEWQKIIDKVSKQLYDGTLKPGHVSPEMIREHALELFKAVKIGFDNVDTKQDINHYTQLRALRENVFVFSGFKNYHQLKEMSLLLTDSEGNIRSFNDFKKDVLSVDATYNKTYLEAEYNHAIRSSTMIAKWQKFTAEADIFPMIRYRTVGDGRVREAHKKLDGITLPIEDEFWNTYFPPNDWNCRCDVEQVESDKKAAPKDLPTTPPMFRSNVGKDGIVFPETHPYYNIKDNNKHSEPKDAKTYITNISLLSMPIEEQWIELHKFNNGGIVLEHVLVDKAKTDYKRNLEIAIDHAKNGKKVEILPIIHAKETELREIIFPNFNKHPKNPDLRIDNEYFEEEQPILPINFNKIKNRIKQGSKQADNVIINMHTKINKGKQYKIAIHRFYDLKTLEVLVFKHKKEYTYWYRKQLIK